MKLFDLVDYCIWLSAIVGIVFYRKVKPKSLRLLVIFICSIIFFETILPNYFTIDSKHYFQRLYTVVRPLEYTIVAYCFFDLLNRKKLKIKIILFSILLYFLYALFLFIAFYNDKYLGNNTSVIGYLLLIILMITYYKELLDSNEIINLKQSPLFILSIGILIFCCGNVIVSGFYLKVAQQSKENAQILYKFMNYGLLIIKSMTTIAAFYVAGKSCKISHEWCFSYQYCSHHCFFNNWLIYHFFYVLLPKKTAKK